MFKKSLLALALAGAAVSAQASTVDYKLTITGTGAGNDIAFDVADATADVVVSAEGFAGAGSLSSKIVANAAATATTALIAANTEMTLYVKNDVAVQSGDFFYVTIPGVVFDTTSTPKISLLTANASADGADNDITVADSNLAFVKYDGESIVFGATGAQAQNSVLLVQGLKLKSTSASTLTPSVVAKNTVIGDYAKGTAKKSIKTVSELSLVKVSTPLNGIIDVSNDRKQFTTAGEGTLKDSLIVDTALETVTTLPITVAPTFDITVAGDFTVLDTDGDNKIEAGEGSVALTGATAVYASDLTSVTFNNLAVAANRTIDINLPATLANRKVLSTQSFTTTIDADYTATSAKTDVPVLTSKAAGSWTLNGSEIEVPYLPFGDNTAPILRLTNSSTKSGDLSVRYMIEGTEATWKSVGVVATIKPGVTNIADLVMDAVKADAKATKGKVALELVTNVPSTAVDVTAGFKVVSEQDRGIVTTVKK